MPAPESNKLPEIPNKVYFTIGEASELCGVKQHVLRYWEQEFEQLKKLERRSNRRYYKRDDIVFLRRLRTLLYERGFTISGARLHLEENSRDLIEQIPDSGTQIDIDEIIKDLENVKAVLREDPP